MHYIHVKALSIVYITYMFRHRAIIHCIHFKVWKEMNKKIVPSVKQIRIAPIAHFVFYDDHNS